MLDDDFNPVSDRLPTFLDWAQQDAAGQDWEKFGRYLRSARSRLKKVEKQIVKKLSANATDWKEDLEEIIATGWTEHGQTNDLISRIVRYAIVFMGKMGKSLRAWVKQVVINSPGYERCFLHLAPYEVCAIGRGGWVNICGAHAGACRRCKATARLSRASH